MKITSEIIDAHMHLPVNYPTTTEKKKALFAEMKRNNVSRGIIISDSELVSSIGNLHECVELFENCPDIAVVGGISPLINYKEQLQLLERYIAQRKVVGIKLYCGHESVYLNDDALKPVYSLAGKYNVPVLFHSGWDNPQYSSPEIIRQVSKTYSDVRLICCHCCYPHLPECFYKLAGYSNVYFDVSSVADGDVVDIKPILEKAIFSMPDRFVFGSDYGCCCQEKHIEFCKQLDISDCEKDLLFYKNAEQLYFNK